MKFFQVSIFDIFQFHANLFGLITNFRTFSKPHFCHGHFKGFTISVPNTDEEEM